MLTLFYLVYEMWKGENFGDRVRTPEYVVSR